MSVKHCYQKILLHSIFNSTINFKSEHTHTHRAQTLIQLNIYHIMVNAGTRSYIQIRNAYLYNILYKSWLGAHTICII